MKLQHSLTPYTEINSKCIKDLNERPDTIKLLGKNLGRMLFDINHSNILFDLLPRIMSIKTKAFSQQRRPLKKTQKDNPQTGRKSLQMMKLQRNNLQNIQKTHTTQQQKTKNPIRKWAEDLNSHFSKRDIQITNRHMKKCSTSLIIREMQIKTTMR